MTQPAITTFAVLALFPLVCGQPALAQDSGVIEEIQVTATRRPVSVMDVSAAVTLVPLSRIENNKLTTDALQAEPGVFLQQTTPGQGAPIIRGLKGSELLHLVDGMRLNNAIFRNAPTQYLALVAAGTVERIEVVRGAPASLYGSDAVGGVVQVLTRMPGADGPGTRRSAYLGIDSAESGKILRASWEAGDDTLAGLVSAEYLETGDRRTGSGERVAPSGYTSKSGRIAIATSPGADTSWLFDLQYARQPSTPRIDELVPGYGQTEPSSSEFRFAPNERSFAHVRHTRRDGPWSADWTIDAAWQQIVDDRVSRDFESTSRSYENNSSDLFGLTVSAAGVIADGSWIVGAEFYHDRVASRRVAEDIDSGQTMAVTARFPDGSTVDQAAAYANLLRGVGERHHLTGGLRFSAIGVDLPATGGIPDSSSHYTDLSADLGWVFDVADNTQWVANVGYGFRAPNVFDLGALGVRPGNRFNVPNPDLDSERILQFDTGIRHRSGRWDLELMLFSLHYTDRIASVLTGDTTPDGRDIVQSRNVASADIRGVESALRWEIAARVSAELVANYTYGVQHEAGGGEDPADRIPPFNGRLSLALQAGEAWVIEPFLRFAAAQDRLSARDVRDIRINPDGTPGWVTVNVAANWSRGDRWRASAGIDNLLDKQYRQHGSGIDATGVNLYLNLHYTW